MRPKYRTMLRALGEKTADSAPTEWSVYVVRCSDDSFYTGIAKNVSARIAAHNSGRGAAYTRARGPVRLLYCRNDLTRSQALIEEARIKALPRSRKTQLISTHGAH